MPDPEKECRCNYHLGLGPNLECPVHGEQNKLEIGITSERDEIVTWKGVPIEQLSREQLITALRAAVKEIYRTRENHQRTLNLMEKF